MIDWSNNCREWWPVCTWHPWQFSVFNYTSDNAMCFRAAWQVFCLAKWQVGPLAVVHHTLTPPLLLTYYYTSDNTMCFHLHAVLHSMVVVRLCCSMHCPLHLYNETIYNERHRAYTTTMHVAASTKNVACFRPSPVSSLGSWRCIANFDQ